MRALVVAGLIVLGGCGRLSFDTSADAPSDAAPFCATHTALFCSELSTMAPWTPGPLQNGMIDLSDGTLHATNTDVIAGDGGEAFLIYTLGVTGTRVRESADVRVDGVGQGEPVFMQVRLTTPTSIHGVEYIYRPAAATYIEEFRDPRDGNPVLYQPYTLGMPSPPAGAWFRLDLELDVTTTPHATVRYDNTVVLDQPLMWNDAGDARIELGLVYVKGPATAWDLRFDNVLADAE